MPQGRRKVPFSGKAKKEQLQQKRNKHEKPKVLGGEGEDVVQEESSVIVCSSANDKASILKDHVTFSAGNVGRKKFDLIFQKESNVELAERREAARKPFKKLDTKALEMDVEDFFPDSCDFPQRPDWDRSMSKAQVETSEAKYFREYVTNLMDKHDQNISYFELNLEVRVCPFYVYV